MVCWLKPGGEVDDPGHGADFDGVSGSWIAVSFGQDAKGLETPNAMLDADAEPAQSMIVSAFIFCQGSCFGFFVGNIDAGMVILKSLIATVGIYVGCRWQWWSAPTDI